LTGDPKGRALYVSTRELERATAAHLTSWISSFEFVLVRTPADFAAIAAAGGQPILPSRIANSGSSLSGIRRYAGPALLAWRWRRYLLNERIDRVYAMSRSNALWLLAGAKMAGSRFVQLPELDSRLL
jgi:hypothetical protein